MDVAAVVKLMCCCLFAVATAAAFHTKDSAATRKPLTKSQPCLPSSSSLDITSSKAKKGKEKEIAKLKRPTALKKVTPNLEMSLL